MTWHCVYCGAWVERESSAHCGEVGHTELIDEEEFDPAEGQYTGDTE